MIFSFVIRFDLTQAIAIAEIFDASDNIDALAKVREECAEFGLFSILSYFSREKYVSPSGTNFAPYIRSQEDEWTFLDLCSYEEQCIRLPLSQCLSDVFAALNLGRVLQRSRSISVVRLNGEEAIKN